MSSSGGVSAWATTSLGEFRRSSARCSLARSSPDAACREAHPSAQNGLIQKDKKASLLFKKKMGGLALPDVIRELLRDGNLLRWDATECFYEVLDGERFEARFNQLRKVRNKSKLGGIERPFSRMHNFYILKTGDKWARTGTRFRPRDKKGYPCDDVDHDSPSEAACEDAEDKSSAAAAAAATASTAAAASATPEGGYTPYACFPTAGAAHCFPHSAGAADAPAAAGQAYAPYRPRAAEGECFTYCSPDTHDPAATGGYDGYHGGYAPPAYLAAAAAAAAAARAGGMDGPEYNYYPYPYPYPVAAPAGGGSGSCRIGRAAPAGGGHVTAGLVYNHQRALLEYARRMSPQAFAAAAAAAADYYLAVRRRSGAAAATAAGGGRGATQGPMGGSEASEMSEMSEVPGGEGGGEGFAAGAADGACDVGSILGVDDLFAEGPLLAGGGGGGAEQHRRSRFHRATGAARAGAVCDSDADCFGDGCADDRYGAVEISSAASSCRPSPEGGLQPARPPAAGFDCSPLDIGPPAVDLLRDDSDDAAAADSAAAAAAAAAMEGAEMLGGTPLPRRRSFIGAGGAGEGAAGWGEGGGGEAEELLEVFDSDISDIQWSYLSTPSW